MSCNSKACMPHFQDGQGLGFLLPLPTGTVRDTYTGGAGGAATSALIDGEAGGARIALHTELFPSLLSSKQAFPGISDSLVQENFSGGKPPDPQVAIESLGD